MATTMQPVIGSNLRVSDVEYTPNQLKELKTQLDADKNILRDIFKESHPKLSEKESTRRFNKLYNSLLKNFKPFISDFKLPSKPTESDVVKWMISEGKKNTAIFFADISDKFAIKDIDPILDLYKIKLTEDVTKLRALRSSLSQNTETAQDNTSSRIKNYRSRIAKYADVIAFFEYCKQLHISLGQIDSDYDSIYIESLFYASPRNCSRFLLYQATRQGSSYADAFLALEYLNEINGLRDIKIIISGSNPTLDRQIDQLKDAALFHIQNGAAHIRSNPKAATAAAFVGDFYKSHGQPNLAEMWYKIANSDKSSVVEDIANTVPQKQPTDISNPKDNKNGFNYITYRDSNMLFEEGYDYTQNIPNTNKH